MGVLDPPKKKKKKKNKNKKKKNEDVPKDEGAMANNWLFGERRPCKTILRRVAHNEISLILIG